MLNEEVITYSTSPSGEKFSMPQKDDYDKELQRIKKFTTKAKEENKEIVVVMGVGFVGAVMAAIIADTKDEKGNNSKFVIGCQRPSFRSYWKIPLLNCGESPVKAEDPKVDEIISRSVLVNKTLIATYNSDCLRYADCVVMDIQCYFTKKDIGKMNTGETIITN